MIYSPLPSHQEGDNPRKHEAVHPEIKTNGLLEHVSLSGTSASRHTTVVFHSVGAINFSAHRLLMS